MNINRIVLLAAAAALVLLSSITVLADDAEINWGVCSQGGTNSSTTNYKLAGTIGQTAVGTCEQTGHKINSGFWQNFTMPFICGDANADGSVNVADCVWMMNYIFVPGSPPPIPLESGQVNCDGSFNVADISWLLNYIFVPESPGPCEC